jgi:hypothetical protein
MAQNRNVYITKHEEKWKTMVRKQKGETEINQEE